MLEYDDREIKSNYVTVISPVNKFFKDNLDCSVPYWRNH